LDVIVVLETRKLGYGGVQQFILDMHFLLGGLDKFITKPINDLANEKCGQALTQYFLQNKDLGAPLKVDVINTRLENGTIREWKMRFASTGKTSRSLDKEFEINPLLSPRNKILIAQKCFQCFQQDMLHS
jgi:hypothetical protein